MIINYGVGTAREKRAFMMSNPAFAHIDAARNDRFMTRKYVEAILGPRNIEAIKTLAAALRAE